MKGLSLHSSRYRNFLEGRSAGQPWLDAIFVYRCKVFEQGLKAVHRQVVFCSFSLGFCFGWEWALGRSHRRTALWLCPQRIIFVKKYGCQALAHMPLHVIGQHAEEDMNPSPPFQAFSMRVAVGRIFLSQIVLPGILSLGHWQNTGGRAINRYTQITRLTPVYMIERFSESSAFG